MATPGWRIWWALCSERGLALRPPAAGRSTAEREQLGLFAASNPINEKLVALDVNSMTPLEALGRLAALVEEAKRSR